MASAFSSVGQRTRIPGLREEKRSTFLHGAPDSLFTIDGSLLIHVANGFRCIHAKAGVVMERVMYSV